MATAARKARKRSGEKFTHKEKTVTPIFDRELPMVFDPKTGGSMYSKRALAKRHRVMDILYMGPTEGYTSERELPSVQPYSSERV